MPLLLLVEGLPKSPEPLTLQLDFNILIELEELLDVRTVDKDGTLNLSYRDRFQSRIIKMRRERSKKIVTDYKMGILKNVYQ